MVRRVSARLARYWWPLLAVLLLAGTAAGTLLFQLGSPRTLLLGTTTSTADSGLIGYLLPDFEERFDVRVDYIAVGSGQALEMGRRGDVDVLLVHSPEDEERFMADGYGVNRTKVMYNQFVIVGPASDPAGVVGSSSGVEAFRRIYHAGEFNGTAQFITRNDRSGTHAREQQIWAAAGLDSSTFGPWYVRGGGLSMGEALTQASERGAYTLSDEGTYWAYKSSLAITILLAQVPPLFNQYHVIAVNPARFPELDYPLALEFIRWLVDPATQARIASFTASGHQLFYPNAEGMGIASLWGNGPETSAVAQRGVSRGAA